MEDHRVWVESNKKNQEWWTTEVSSATVREKKEAWKVIEKIKVNGNQPDGGMLNLNGQKKKQPRKLWTRPGMIWKQICTLN